jgi:hypothetical protein
VTGRYIAFSHRMRLRGSPSSRYLPTRRGRGRNAAR